MAELLKKGELRNLGLIAASVEEARLLAVRIHMGDFVNAIAGASMSRRESAVDGEAGEQQCGKDTKRIL
jgi:hypothetical protein